MTPSVFFRSQVGGERGRTIALGQLIVGRTYCPIARWLNKKHTAIIVFWRRVHIGTARGVGKSASRSFRSLRWRLGGAKKLTRALLLAPFDVADGYNRLRVASPPARSQLKFWSQSAGRDRRASRIPSWRPAISWGRTSRGGGKGSHATTVGCLIDQGNLPIFLATGELVGEVPGFQPTCIARLKIEVVLKSLREIRHMSRTVEDPDLLVSQLELFFEYR